MNVNETLENLDNHCVKLDWKCEISDALFCMNDSWKNQQDILQNEIFISLAENYNAETPIDYLPALGQEFSVHGWALYTIDEGNDEYCLVIVPKEHLQEFEKAAKSKKLKIHLQQQPRKKFGDPAKRLNFAGQIQSEKIAIKGDLDLLWPLSICEERSYNDGAYAGSKFTFLDITTWPVIIHPTSEITRLAYSEKHKITAAIFFDRGNKKSVLKISSSPLDPDSWKEILFPESDLHPLCKLFWLEEDLLILHEKCVWLAPSATMGLTACRKIMEATNPRLLTHGTFPNVAKTGNGKIYILLHEYFYRWENHQLVPLGIRALEHYDFNSFPTGENCFVYMAKDKLVEADMSTGKMRHRILEYLDHKTTIQPYSEEWAVFLRFGYTNKSLDIAQFWNPKTDTWLRMPLGSLGKYGIREILLHPDGYSLISSGDNLLFKADHLLEQLEKKKKKSPAVSHWNEN